MSQKLFKPSKYRIFTFRSSIAFIAFLFLTIIQANAQVPANNDCSGVIAASVNIDQSCGSVTSVNLIDATASGVSSCGNFYSDVWYSFTATTSSHSIYFSNPGPSNPTNYIEYQVFDVCGGTEIVCESSYEIGYDGTNLLNGLSSGTSYILRIGQNYNSLQTTDFEFDFCLGTFPVNNDCAGASALTVNPDQNCGIFESLDLNNYSGNNNSSSCGSEYNTAWYSFVATASTHSILFFNDNIAGGNTPYLDYEILDACNGNQITCESYYEIGSYYSGGVKSISGLTSGSSYRIKVSQGNNSTLSGQYSFDFCLGTFPANNVCAGATALTVNPDQNCGVFESLDLYNYSGNNNSSSCGSEYNTAWYSFVATASTHSILFFNDNIAGGNTPYLDYEILDACNGNQITCESYYEIGSYYSGGVKSISGLTSGSSYRIKVSQGNNSTISGQYSFDFCLGTFPANNVCAGATALTVNSDQNCGSFESLDLYNYSGNNNSSSCGSEYNTAWYSFVATTSTHSILFFNDTIAGGNSPYLDYEVLDACSGSQITCETSYQIGSSYSGGVKSISGLTSGSSYRIKVSQGNNSTLSGQYSFDFCLGTFPANNDCAGATALTVNSDQNCGTIESIDLQNYTQNNSSSCGSAYNSAWYSFTATTSTHTILFSNAYIESGNSPSIAYEILDACNGTQIDCESSYYIDNIYSGGTKLINGLTSGNTYIVQVSQDNSSYLNSEYSFDICLGTVPAPLNDECVTSTNIPVNTDLNCNLFVSADLAGSTASSIASTCNTFDRDIWFNFTASSTDHILNLYNFNIDYNYNSDIYIQITDICGGTEFHCSTYDFDSDLPQTISGLTVNSNYQIRMSYSSSDFILSDFNFDVCIGTVAAPANDDCNNAITLTVNSDLDCTVSTPASLAGATGSLPAGSCNSFDRDIWYSFTATNTTHVLALSNPIFGNYSSNINYVLNDICGGIETNCDYYVLNYDGPKLLENLMIGNTYILRLSHSNSNLIISNNSFDICIGTPIAPSNDDCANSLVVGVNPDVDCGLFTSVNLKGATASSNSSSCGDFDSDIWFHFTATNTQHVVSFFNENVGNYSDYLDILITDACGGNEILCTDFEFDYDGPQEINGLTIGNEYKLRISSDDYNEILSDLTFDVCIGTYPPNNICSGAIPLPVNADLNCGTVTNVNLKGYSQSGQSGCTSFYGDAWFTFTATGNTHSFLFNNASVGTYDDEISFQVLDACGGNEIECESYYEFSYDGQENVTGLIAGNDYILRLSHREYDAVTTDFTFDVCIGSFPANNDCSGATTLTVNSDLNCGVVESVDLNNYSENNSSNCGSAYNSAWYSFTASSTTHSISFSNAYIESGNSPRLDYEVLDACSGNQIVCDDYEVGSSYNGGTHEISGLTIGNTYTLQISQDNDYNLDDEYSFDICLGTFPANNNCSGATPISINPDFTCTTLNNVNLKGYTESNASSGCGSFYGDAWFTFTALDVQHTISFINANVGTYSDYLDYQVIDACGGNEIVCESYYGIDNSGVNNIAGLTVGNDYILRVSHNEYYGASDDFIFDICLGTNPSVFILWTGTTDTDWNTATNWSTGTVPLATDNIVVPDVSGVSGNFPLITPITSIKNLTINVDASLFINTGIVLDGTFTNNGTVVLKDGAYLDDFTNPNAAYFGDITVERIAANGTGNNQRFISSPINTAPVSEIGDDLVGPWGIGLPGANGVAVTIDDCALQTLTSGSNYGNLFGFDETLINTCALDGWVVKSAGNLVNGAAYSAYLPSGSTFDLTGAPNTGNISIPITNSGAGVAVNEGWNMVGNPYPSPLQRNEVINAGGLNAQYYVASGPYQGSFAPYMFGDNIAIGQGIQVYTTTNTTLNLTNSMRSTGTSTWYNTGSWFVNKLEVSVFGNNGADKTILYYNNEATNNYEALYDVTKRDSDLGNPTLSTFTNNNNLGLNGLNLTNLGETVPMHFKAGTDGSFSLKFDGLETFGQTTIYLRDLLLNTFHNISEGDYNFNANTIDSENRFELMFIPEVKLLTAKVDCDENLGSISLAIDNITTDRTYELSSSNTLVSSGDLSTLNYNAQVGIYDLVVFDAFGTSQLYIVEIEALEKITASFNISSTNVFVGEAIQFSSTSLNAINTTWSFSDGNSLNDVTNSTYTFDQAGVYELMLNVSNEECTDIHKEIITVSHKTTAIDNITSDFINIYPNPVEDLLIINWIDELKVEIFNSIGVLVIEAKTNKINTSNLNSGVYIVHIYDNDMNLISTNKVLKK